MGVKFSISVLGSFGPFPIFADLVHIVISEMANRRAKRTKLWVSGVSIKCIKVLLTVECSSSVWGHSVHFRFSGDLISRKQVVLEQNGPKLGLRGKWLVPAEYLHVSLLNLQGQFGVIRCIYNFDDLVSTLDLNIHGFLYC